MHSPDQKEIDDQDSNAIETYQKMSPAERSACRLLICLGICGGLISGMVFKDFLDYFDNRVEITATPQVNPETKFQPQGYWQKDPSIDENNVLTAEVNAYTLTDTIDVESVRLMIEVGQNSDWINAETISVYDPQTQDDVRTNTYFFRVDISKYLVDAKPGEPVYVSYKVTNTHGDVNNSKDGTREAPVPGPALISPRVTLTPVTVAK